MPLAIAVTVLTALHEVGLDLHLGPEQMLPLVPSGVPHNRHGRRVEEDFQLAAGVAVNSTVVVEVHLAQGGAEAPLVALGEKRQDASDEEDLTVPRSIPGHEKRAEAPVREEYGALRVGQQLVVAGAQLGLGQDVKGPL